MNTTRGSIIFSHVLSSTITWPDASLNFKLGYEEIKLKTYFPGNIENSGPFEPYKPQLCAISNGYLIHTANQDSQEEICSVFDEIGSEAWPFYEQCALPDLFENVVPEKVIIISDVAVNPKYRRFNVGHSVVKTWVKNLYGPSNLFLLHPGSTYRPTQKYCRWYSWTKKDKRKRRFDRPEEVLTRYWKIAGFREWGGSGHMYFAGKKLQRLLDQGIHGRSRKAYASVGCFNCGKCSVMEVSDSNYGEYICPNCGKKVNGEQQ